MQQNGRDAGLGDQERLFLSLIEQLSRPFLQIATVSELQAGMVARATASSGLERESGGPAAALLQPEWQLVQAIASSSLQLTESYALSLRVHGKVTALELEPVTVSSLLYDTAHALTPYARQYAVELELDSGPKMQPILADRAVLQSAMTALGQVFVAAQSEAEDRMPVRLSAHRSRYGVVAGLYGQAATLGADSLRRAEQLTGAARQPLSKLVSGPAAGVFVAESLLRALSAKLHVARYHNVTGLATTLQPSQQLQLI